MPRFVTALTAFLVSMAAADTQVLQTIISTEHIEGAVNLNNWLALATLKSTGAYVQTGDSLTTFKIKGNEKPGYEWKAVEADAHGYFTITTTYVEDARSLEEEFWNGRSGTFYFTINAGDDIPAANEEESDGIPTEND